MGLEGGSKKKGPELDHWPEDTAWLKTFEDPKSEHYQDRLADEVVRQLDKHKEERGYSHSIFLKVKELLEKAGISEEISGKVATKVHEKIRDREIGEGQAEMRDLASNKIRTEAEKRWTEDGISEQEQQRKWWQR